MGRLMPVFGVNATDGTLALCKAKPENRGRGNCFHGDHVDLEGPMAAAATISAYNEERLKEHFGGSTPPPAKKPVPKPFPARPIVQARPGGAVLTADEFDTATKNIADAFPQDSWDLLNNFYQKFTHVVEMEDDLHGPRLEAIARVREYLESDDETAVKVRAYLGEEVSPADFAAILVSDVRAMTARVKHRNGPKTDSFSRVMLTSVANDMNKQRYVASILFFGGRCCYCNCVMSKNPGPRQATGEHLTPINPETEAEPVGATRYGNMAMACDTCNNDRKNKELKTWLRETQCVAEDMKPYAMARIEAFRRFALYEEFSMEQSNKLREEVAAMKQYAAQFTRARGVYGEEDYEKLKTHLANRIFELQDTIRA